MIEVEDQVTVCAKCDSIWGVGPWASTGVPHDPGLHLMVLYGGPNKVFLCAEPADLGSSSSNK